ncbi:HD-GYP domain-containing protein [uncultured Dechloromonas sp.]|uniref:HD-GYP domain-containing protein n=1 Tax=uncultured Dechloromonas sp. TaxID=171719 RepID=UPI0025E06FB8|nr:HD-GYP domain-containing protein [uncultured Dechloromonas sp.]
MSAIQTIASIRWMLLRRLLAVWLVVSLVAAGMTYYLEVSRFEEGLVAIASEEVRHLSTSPAGDTDEAQSLLANETRQFISTHYLWIKVHDDQGKLVRELANPTFEKLTDQLQPSIQAMARDGRRHFEKLQIGEQPVIRILVTVPAPEGKLFLEGAFLLDRLTLQQQRAKTWRTIGFVLLSSLLTALALYPVVLLLYRSLIKASKEILRGNLEIAAVLGSAIAKRDSDTGEHNYRVTLYAIHLAKAVEAPTEAMRGLIIGSFLHDVGKIGIPDAILLKPGRLDDQEFAEMREHVRLGLEIVADSHWLKIARDIIGHHHEKYDGSGYPKGLRGDEIPFAARIFAIVDVFDALTSRRPYKEALTAQQALEIQGEGAGSHFDPSLLEQFRRIASQLHSEIHDKNEAELRESLTGLLPRYFLKLN